MSHIEPHKNRIDETEMEWWFTYVLNFNVCRLSGTFLFRKNLNDAEACVLINIDPRKKQLLSMALKNGMGAVSI